MTDILYLIFYIVFYLIIIYYIHELWNYLVNQYSNKHTKDIIGIQTNKYIQIIDELQNNTNNTTEVTEVTDNSFISNQEQMSMNNELMSFLEKIE
jgi:hypothetical protein|tara:strand:+ start:629 stop:913 length:285 start_codon:yes stop_codon:yes gene_type:complete